MVSEITINITKQMAEQYNSGNLVLLWDDENVNFSITLDKKYCSSRRINLKKIGCYLLSARDTKEINLGNAHLTYSGKTKIFVKNISGVMLK